MHACATPALRTLGLGNTMPKKAARSAKKVAKKGEELATGSGDKLLVWAFRGIMALMVLVGVLTSGAFDFLFFKSTRGAAGKGEAGEWAPERLMEVVVLFCSDHAEATAATAVALVLAPVGHWVFRKWQAAAALQAKEAAHRQADTDAKQQRVVRREQKAVSRARGKEAAAEAHQRWVVAEAEHSKRKEAVMAHRAMRQEAARQQLAVLQQQRAAEIARDRSLAEEINKRWEAQKRALEDILKEPEVEEWQEEEDQDGDEDDEDGEEEQGEDEEPIDESARQPLKMLDSSELEATGEGTRLDVLQPEFVRIMFVQLETVKLALQCERCHASCDAQLSGLWEGENSRKQWCEGCTGLMSVTLKPTYAHEGSSVLGFFDCVNCTVVDTSAAIMVTQCTLSPFLHSPRWHTHRAANRRVLRFRCRCIAWLVAVAVLCCAARLFVCIASSRPASSVTPPSACRHSPATGEPRRPANAASAKPSWHSSRACSSACSAQPGARVTRWRAAAGRKTRWKQTSRHSESVRRVRRLAVVQQAMQHARVADTHAHVIYVTYANHPGHACFTDALLPVFVRRETAADPGGHAAARFGQVQTLSEVEAMAAVLLLRTHVPLPDLPRALRLPCCGTHQS